ncbi:MAG: M20/M25/M40 family metallo-hydrolase, partial [Oscillospiraceae bacterium]
MVKTMKALAEQGNIPHQMDVITAGGTDAGAIHQTRAGVQTGGISIPCRYIHSPAELVDRGDVEACVKLVCAFAKAQLS